MGEGVAMRHTCNRRVKDAEEVGPPRGGWGGREGLDPSPLPMLCACRQHAGMARRMHSGGARAGTAVVCIARLLTTDCAHIHQNLSLWPFGADTLFDTNQPAFHDGDDTFRCVRLFCCLLRCRLAVKPRPLRLRLSIGRHGCIDRARKGIRLHRDHWLAQLREASVHAAGNVFVSQSLRTRVSSGESRS